MQILFSFFLFAGLVAALVTPNSTLSRRAKDSVPAHLGKTSTFYRAVTTEEVAFVTANYPKGSSPTRHGTSGGDFTVDGTGGLYVFDTLAEADVYGRCHSKNPLKTWPNYYIITMQYTPSKSLKTKSFTKDDSTWASFVNDCYANKKHSYAIVEGPYSMEKNKKKVGAPQQGGGTDMLWQAAFVGKDALKTLKVTDVRKVNTPGAPSSCNIL
ncbi:hypothetical protein ONZ45_g7087 [Pleurotus djamor]|nr:hypothetical protein ONZ45_g7087 [Pleurotus djamor]